jgi:hypothetical protein
VCKVESAEEFLVSNIQRNQELQLAVNFTLISILKKNFPSEYKQRAEEEKTEELESKEKKGDPIGVSPISEGLAFLITTTRSCCPLNLLSFIYVLRWL